MPNYTLYYFNGRGRAEILRMMMAAAGVKYMDKRFDFNEWDKYRKDMPCMRVPVLEMDGGMKMPETMAIARYLAREHNFYPKNSMDMMRCDYIADCFYEIMHDYMRYYHWKNGRFRFGENGMMSSDNQSNSGDMDPNYDNYLQWRYMNTLNRIMPFMERTLSMRNGGSQFFMGDQMMWCDMMCHSCLENPYMENQSMFSSYPKLMALRTRVSAHPKISAYLKSRTNTQW
uniref:S-crystallin n=1 Tax=Doryteuthis opalescens TaxID=1051066 RepID=Q25361_DOROP|nr:S-crystallin [Doryteuthis opalescens]